MIPRPHWIRRIESAWSGAPIVWLTGVRRAGKTVLCRAFADAEFVNCDLPSSMQRLADPESFFASLGSRRVVLDEVHQLADPSRVLKIAADAYPRLRILATGSSTLAATAKFRDSLAGRRRTVELLPVLLRELEAFSVRSLDQRLLRGGLPQFLLSTARDEGAYSEWLDAYYARDVQELFRLRSRGNFLKLTSLLLRNSGGLLEQSSLAKHAGISRPSLMAWLDVLQVTHVVHLVRPFAGGGRREILAQPKVYGFDTGFVCHARGWDSLRQEDRGLLWEHLVLDELLAMPAREVRCWRDKQQREIDFVIPRGRGVADAIECKWQPERFEPRSLKAFRELHPQGRNLVVCPAIDRAFERRVGDLRLEFVPGAALAEHLD